MVAVTPWRSGKKSSTSSSTSREKAAWKHLLRTMKSAANRSLSYINSSSSMSELRRRAEEAAEEGFLRQWGEADPGTADEICNSRRTQ